MVRPAESLEHEALIAYDVWLCERREFGREGFPGWAIWAVVFGGLTVFLGCLIVNLYALVFGGMEFHIGRMWELGEPWRP